jgi:hypothetical protein
MSTESMRSETPRQLSQRRRHQHLRRFHHSTLTETRYQLSHCRMLKNLNNSSTKSKHSKPLLFCRYMFDQCIKPEQKNLIQV